jgi:hypothetical protein
LAFKLATAPGWPAQAAVPLYIASAWNERGEQGNAPRESATRRQYDPSWAPPAMPANAATALHIPAHAGAQTAAPAVGRRHGTQNSSSDADNDTDNQTLKLD